MSLYGRVLRYVWRYPLTIAAAVLATLGFAAFDAFSLVMLIPFLKQLFGESPFELPGGGGDEIQWLLDHTVAPLVDGASTPQELLLGIILVMLGVYLLKNVFDFLQLYLSARLEQRVTRDLRNQVYGHLVHADLGFFGRTRAGQVISRLTSDVDQVRTLVTKNLVKFGSSIFQVLVTLAVLLSMSVELTLVALVATPVMIGLFAPLVKRLRRNDRRVLDIGGDVTSHLQESLAGIRLVKAFVAERFETQRFQELTRRYYRTFLRSEAMRAMAGPMTEMVGALGTVLLLWYGTRLVLAEGVMDGAQFIAFLALSLKLYSPIKWLSKFPATVAPGLSAAERIFEFLDVPIEVRDRPGARALEGDPGVIRFEDVSFGYDPAEPVLRDVSLEVPAGSVIALVGPSGAGKTTLVDLLARFYDPVEGRITIDGTDIRDYTMGSLRSRMGMVTQETVLFHDTVRANIAYGMPDTPQAEVERAARAAHAHQFIEALPLGYDTIVGERGTRLSGGQRQRIAIARALLRDPPILIFDEATSALDTESERLVQDAIERLLEGRTVFVIAHRLSTIRHADTILVLQDGRIVERGRHDELLVRGGVYQRLHEMQFADVPERAGAPGAS